MFTPRGDASASVIWWPSSFLCDAFATTAQYVLMVVMCIYGRVSIRFPSLSLFYMPYIKRGIV